MATDAKPVPTETLGLAPESRGPLAPSGLGGSAVRPVNSTPRLRNGNLSHWQALSNLPRGWAEELDRKWQYLRNQESFLHSPVNTILRLIFWRAKSFLRSPA